MTAREPLPERWGGNLNSIPHLCKLLLDKGYTPTDFYWTVGGEKRLQIAERTSTIRADSLQILRWVIEELPIRVAPGEVCEYESIHGTIEVVFLCHNDVPDWPIRTAQVRMPNGREDSVRVKQLRPTGRRSSNEARPLVFGQSMRG